MKTFFRIDNKAKKYKAISLFVFILILFGITYCIISNPKETKKPLIQILDLRQDSISNGLIDELYSKGISFEKLSNYSDIKNSFKENSTKLVIIVRERKDVFFSEIFTNQYNSIIPNALIRIVNDIIEHNSKKYTLNNITLLDKQYLI